MSVGHRTAAFMESYFDILWAMNNLTHPGEKQLVSLCKKQCRILPACFEEKIRLLCAHLFTEPERIDGDIKRIIAELNKIL